MRSAREFAFEEIVFVWGRTWKQCVAVVGSFREIGRVFVSWIPQAEKSMAEHFETLWGSLSLKIQGPFWIQYLMLSASVFAWLSIGPHC